MFKKEAVRGMIYLEHGSYIGLPVFKAIDDLLLWYIYNPWPFERRAFGILWRVKTNKV